MMKLPIKLAIHSLSVVCLVFYALLPVNRYAWMQDMDPGMTTLPEDGSGNSKLVGLLFLIFALCLQFLALFFSGNRYEKRYSIVFILAAGIIFLFKTMSG